MSNVSYKVNVVEFSHFSSYYIIYLTFVNTSFIAERFIVNGKSKNYIGKNPLEQPWELIGEMVKRTWEFQNSQWLHKPNDKIIHTYYVTLSYSDAPVKLY